MQRMSIEIAKKQACIAAVQNHINATTTVIGIGSGSTIIHVPLLLKDLQNQGQISLKACVPTSFQSKQLILDHGLPLGDLNQFPIIDVCIDGADEVDQDLNLIKGGGACQLQEKLVASCSKSLIIVADESKDAHRLGETWQKGIPLEVIPFGYVHVMNKLKQMNGLPVLRMAVKKAGPVVTDNGNFIIDCSFEHIQNVAELALQLDKMVGIVEHGLFVNMASKVYFGKSDGSVYSR